MDAVSPNENSGLHFMFSHGISAMGTFLLFVKIVILFVKLAQRERLYFCPVKMTVIVDSL